MTGFSLIWLDCKLGTAHRLMKSKPANLSNAAGKVHACSSSRLTPALESDGLDWMETNSTVSLASHQTYPTGFAVGLPWGHTASPVCMQVAMPAGTTAFTSLEVSVS